MNAWGRTFRARVLFGFWMAFAGQPAWPQNADEQAANDVEEESAELLDGEQPLRDGFFRKVVIDTASEGSEALEFVFRATARRFDSMADALLAKPDQEFPLGLEGYCPVTLKHAQRWQLGDARWSKVFEGRTYHFAGPRERDLFVAKSKTYAPAAGGNDLVVLAETGRSVPGVRSAGVWYKEQIYLFREEQSLQKFAQAPHQYLQKKAPPVADPLAPESPIAEKFRSQPFEGTGLVAE